MDSNRNKRKYRFIEVVQKFGLTVITLICVVLFFKTFFISGFKIPTESMLPNIWPGDYICVDKFGYGRVQSVFGKDYHLPKFRDIKRGDIMVFHFPEGDTVFVDNPVLNYYDSKRMSIVSKQTSVEGNVIQLPISLRLPYVKRCIGFPGDSLGIINGKIFINQKEYQANHSVKRWYHVYANNNFRIQKVMDDIRHCSFKRYGHHYVALLTHEEKKELQQLVDDGLIDNIKPYYEKWINHSTYPFLGDSPEKWTWDNYGPVYIPKEGDTLSLRGDNFYMYHRLVKLYENNDLKVRNDSLFINGKHCEEYVCKQNYYFMIGDNRHNSMDSRNWGLVPEDHIIGRAFVVGWSKDTEGVRWYRIGNNLIE